MNYIKTIIIFLIFSTSPIIASEDEAFRHKSLATNPNMVDQNSSEWSYKLQLIDSYIHSPTAPYEDEYAIRDQVLLELAKNSENYATRHHQTMLEISKILESDESNPTIVPQMDSRWDKTFQLFNSYLSMAEDENEREQQEKELEDFIMLSSESRHVDNGSSKAITEHNQHNYPNQRKNNEKLVDEIDEWTLINYNNELDQPGLSKNSGGFLRNTLQIAANYFVSFTVGPFIISYLTAKVNQAMIMTTYNVVMYTTESQALSTLAYYIGSYTLPSVTSILVFQAGCIAPTLFYYTSKMTWKGVQLCTQGLQYTSHMILEYWKNSEKCGEVIELIERTKEQNKRLLTNK